MAIVWKLVRAKADLEYGNLTRLAGEIFNVEEDHFDPAAHEPIDRDAYLADPKAFDPKPEAE